MQKINGGVREISKSQIWAFATRLITMAKIYLMLFTAEKYFGGVEVISVKWVFPQTFWSWHRNVGLSPHWAAIRSEYGQKRPNEGGQVREKQLIYAAAPTSCHIISTFDGLRNPAWNHQSWKQQFHDLRRDKEAAEEFSSVDLGLITDAVCAGLSKKDARECWSFLFFFGGGGSDVTDFSSACGLRRVILQSVVVWMPLACLSPSTDLDEVFSPSEKPHCYSLTAAASVDKSHFYCSHI